MRERHRFVTYKERERERERGTERESDPMSRDWQESLDVYPLLLPFISHGANRAGNRLLVNAN